MTTQQIDQMLKRGESQTLEFKRCGNGVHSDIYETICSFSNRMGGNLLLGVNDNADIVGIPEKMHKKIEQQIIAAVNNSEFFSPLPLLEIERITYQGKTIIRIWVPMSPSVHRFREVVYDRIGDSDMPIKGESNITMMYMRKQNWYSEQRIFPYLEVGDLRRDVIDHARKLAVSHRKEHPWKTMSNEEILHSAKLIGCNYETGAKGYNLAAALLFGRDEVIAACCASYKTDAILRKEDLDRYDDRIDVRTNLIESYSELMSFCRKHLSEGFALDGSIRVSPREVITRELIANSLMHREYASPFPAKLIIDRQGIHTENASRSIFEGSLTLEKYNPVSKNPIIANFFKQIGYAEELGSGIRNLYKYSRIYVDATPVLLEGDIFRATIPPKKKSGAKNNLLTIADATERLLDEVGFATSAAVAQLSGKTSRAARRYLAQLVDIGDLRSEGETRSRRYYRV